MHALRPALALLVLSLTTAGLAGNAKSAPKPVTKSASQSVPKAANNPLPPQKPPPAPCQSVEACVQEILQNMGQADLRPTFAAMQILDARPKPKGNVFLASGEWPKRAREAAATGNPAQGIELLQQALTIAPNDDFLHTELGSLLLQQGELEAAYQAFLQAVVLVPWRKAAWDGLSAVYQARGETRQAAAALAVAYEWSSRKSPLKIEYAARSKQAEYAQALELINQRNVQSLHLWHEATTLKDPGQKAVFSQRPDFSCNTQQYPLPALRKAEEGTVIIEYLSAADGGILDSRILLSSGTQDLDAAARLLVSACYRLPPPIPAKPGVGQARFDWHLE